MKKILMISKCPTHPTNAGNRWGQLAMCETLKKLGCEVDFLYIDERSIHESYIKEDSEDYMQTKDYWGHHFYHFQIGRIRKIYRNILKRYRINFNGYHRGLYDEYPIGLSQMVKKLDKIHKYDICIINYIYLAKLFKHISIPKKAVFTHDALSYKNLMVNDKKCIWYDAHQEASALQLCTDVFAVQDEEMHYFHILSPQSRLYNIYSKYDYHPQPVTGNKNILFLSGNNGYNQNGLRWFLKEIFPLILEKHPDAKLLIAGGICKVINDIEGTPGVELKGFVENPADFYALGDIAINPTFQGTGLKIKTFEAIANDKVTMVHPHSKAGVFKADTAPLFSSNNPSEWVKFLDKVWSNKELIANIKISNKEYLTEMNEFIMNEYKRFLEVKIT